MQMMWQQTGGFGDLSFTGAEVFIVASMLGVILSGLTFLYKQVITAKDIHTRFLEMQNAELMVLLKSSVRSSEKTTEMAKQTLDLTDEQLAHLLSKLREN